MKETKVCKAEPLGGTLLESHSIIIDDKIPSSSWDSSKMTLAEYEKFYEKQAKMINDALALTLPQGTYDRLGIMFMQRKVSLYQGKTGT